MLKLSVHLVTWNGAKYIPHLFESLRKQTFKDWTLFVFNNNSQDNTVELIKKELNNFCVQARIVESSENLGFSGGHNRAYQATDSEYFLIINQDMVLPPDCLEKLVKFMDENLGVSAAAPRLMRWQFPDVFSNKIDCLGLKFLRSRRVMEIGRGEEWNGSGENKEVPGLSGAMSIFRRADVAQILLRDQMFDESYGSYKEDIDLAYRMASRGFKSFIVGNAAAYHDRAAAGAEKRDDFSAVKNKETQTSLIKLNSYRNHLITLYKNEYWQNLLLDFPFILWYELKKFIYFLVFDRAVLKGWADIWRARDELKIKRAEIKKLRKKTWKEIRRMYV